MIRQTGTLLVLGGLTLVAAQEWVLEDLQKRMQSQGDRLEAIRQQVFLRYGAELGFESADQMPIMDREYEELSLKVRRIEEQIARDRAVDAKSEAIARQEAKLAAAQAAQKAREQELARQRAAAEAKRLAEIEAPFREALGYYNRQQFPEAYERFIKLYFDRDDSVPVGFYTGRTAFETKRYEIAAGAYQQVLTLEPDHRRARLELARTYYVMGLHQEARVEFLRVEQSGDLPVSVRQNIHAYLEAIEAAQKRHFLNGQLVAGLGYDSNVNQGNDYLPSWLQPFTSDPVNPAQSDTFLSLVSFNTHRYDFGLPGGWQWQSDLLVYLNRYSDLSENDLTLLGLKSGPLVDLPVGRVRLPVGYDKVWVDGEGLLQMMTLACSLERPIGSAHMVRGHLKWLDRTNDNNADQDATGYELGGDWQIMGGEQNSVTTVGLLYVSEASKQGDRSDTDFSAIALRGGYTWLREGWSAGLQTQMRKTDFDRPFVDTQSVDRADTQLTLALSGSWQLRSDLVLSGQLSRIDNDSSYAPYDYAKNLLQFNLGWNWGI